MGYLDKTGLARFWAGIKTRLVLKSAIVNTLTSTATDAPLSAAQGKALKTAVDAKLAAAAVFNALTQTADGYALDARQGAALKTLIDGKQATINGSNAAAVRTALGLQNGALNIFKSVQVSVSCPASSTGSSTFTFSGFSSQPKAIAYTPTTVPGARAASVIVNSATGGTVYAMNNTSSAATVTVFVFLFSL